MTTNPFSLEGKVALVSGGAGDGIGGGLSRMLARCGAAVMIADIQAERAEQLAAALSAEGCTVRARAVDVRRDDSVREAVEETVRTFGGLDALVNSAGIGMIAPIDTYSPAEYDNLVEINVKGTVRFCRHAVPELRKRGGGAIVNIASVQAEAMLPGYVLYASTKGAVVSMTRALAVDLGPDRIRVNTVLPGMVDCRQTRDTVAKWTNDVDGWMQAFVRRNQSIPVATTAEQVGSLVAYLVSDAAAAISGTDIVIDGGQLAMLMGRDS